MNQTLSEIAIRLDNAAKQGRTIEQISLQQTIDLDEAYQIQKLSIDSRLKRGETLTGYKLGFTSKEKMEQMGVHELIWGRLTNEMDKTAEGRINMGFFIHPRVEPEVAFIIKKDISGPIKESEYMQYVEAVAPALEIIDSRYANFKFSLEDVIADNCSSSAYVLGQRFDADTKINDVVIRMDINDKTIREGNTRAILEDPKASLFEAARLAGKYGFEIKAGMVVLAGAATPAEFLKKGDRVVADFDHLGRITLLAE